MSLFDFTFMSHKSLASFIANYVWIILEKRLDDLKGWNLKKTLLVWERAEGNRWKVKIIFIGPSGLKKKKELEIGFTVIY